MRAPFIVLAVIAIMRHDPVWALVWTLLGVSTDYIDGFVAKRGWLGGTSELGKVLDPLLDKPMILVPGFAVAAVLYASPVPPLGIAVGLGLVLIALREIAVFLWKKSMAQISGLQSAGQHGRASMAFQCLGLLILIPSALAALTSGDATTILVLVMMAGTGTGMMVAASYVAGWVYYVQYRDAMQI